MNELQTKIWVPMWGISKLRRRGGSFAGAIPGDARWFDAWYSHAMSEETFEKLRRLGVGVVILPFSLGGTAEQEAEEHDDFARAAKLLHARGMLALPYLQYQNLLEGNTPPGTVWAEGPNGEWRGYAYWRRTACQSSPGFRNYFREVISDAVRRGADGLWIDNTYLRPCWCPLCRKAFAEYTGRPEQTMPTDPSFPGADRTMQAFLRFNTERNLAILKQCRDWLNELKPGALFGSNPALYRGANIATNGVDLAGMLPTHDLIYLENRLFPTVSGGHAVGNHHGFTAAESLGCTAVAGAWKASDLDEKTGRPVGEPMPQAGDAPRVLLEAATFGGMPGIFWAIREMPDSRCRVPEDKLKMYFEDAEMTSSLEQVGAYFRTLPLAGMRNAATIGVLRHTESLMLDHPTAPAAGCAIEELLVRHGIPFRTVTSLQETAGLTTLILPRTRVLSDEEIELVRAFPGQVLVLGADTGLFDETRQRRLATPFANCFAKLAGPVTDGHVTVVPIAESSNAGSFRLMRGEFQIPAWNEEQILARLAARPELSETLIGASWRTGGGYGILQLLDYADRAPFTLKIRLKTAKKTQLFRFGGEPEELTGPEYTIRNFHVHALLRFELEAGVQQPF